MSKPANTKLRFNIATTFIYIIGIILLLQLFNLQIIHGKEYREQSNTRLTRESTLEASRGSILDRTGNKIAVTKMGFNVELYKSKVDTNILNDTILNIVNVLEANGDKYVDSFPITINPFAFNFQSDEKLAKWKEDNKIDENATAEDCFYIFKKRYNIQNENIDEVRKIIAIRYQIVQEGYSSTKPVTIASDISRQSALQFNEKNSEFPGINVVTEPIREYVSGNLASHIIGTIGKIGKEELNAKKDTYDANDYVGTNGIEYVFEDYLKGKNGTKQIDMAVDGTVTDEYISEEAIAGSDVVLTIDANLQKVAETALENNIHKINNGEFGKQYDTNSGAVVVMNVKTGEVLAMASYPDYNPQAFVGGISNEDWKLYNSSDKPLINKAVQMSYSPGSTFKMITAIAGLESEVITTKEKINDTGVYKKYNSEWKCWYYTDYHKGHGWVNVSDAIKHSCNYFFYEVGDRMGIDNLEKYARYFGLGNKTGIELPSETSGVLASKSAKQQISKEQWYPGDTLSASIGQSYNEFSPLQMAKYISILANGGKKVDVTIVKSIITADGTEVPREEYESKVNEKLGLNIDDGENLEIKQENIQAVLEGMRSVAMEAGGTAYNIFKNFSIEIGGKTGSAEAPNNKVNAWFAGFAPYEDPEIAVVVMVENGGHGNYTAEVVREIIDQYFGMNANQVQEDMTAKPYTETAR